MGGKGGIKYIRVVCKLEGIKGGKFAVDNVRSPLSWNARIQTDRQTDIRGNFWGKTIRVGGIKGNTTVILDDPRGFLKPFFLNRSLSGFFVGKLGIVFEIESFFEILLPKQLSKIAYALIIYISTRAVLS